MKFKGFFSCECGKMHMVSALIVSGSKCVCGRYLVKQMIDKCGHRLFR